MKKLECEKTYSPSLSQNIYTCLDRVSSVSLSPDSRLLTLEGSGDDGEAKCVPKGFVMAVVPNRNCVQLWAIDDSGWTCRYSREQQELLD
jgi:hypothetical protein